MPFRVGGSLGTTIYYQIGAEGSKQDVYLGIMDTPELARMVVSHFNSAESQTLLIMGTDSPNAYFPFKAHIRQTTPVPLKPQNLISELERKQQAKAASLLRHPSRNRGLLPEFHEEEGRD